jgi:arylsulfatase A-like enzyme
MKFRAAILITIACLLASCQRSEFAVKKPNIIFLMLDTLRADHMGGYGYERDTTPNLDAFASENLKADFAVSTAPWTPTSVASMFTGLYPSSHGMIPPNDREIAKSKMSKLASSHLTMAEILKGNGYKTIAVSPNPWITKEFGYTQGFDEYYYLHREIAAEITESGREVIDAWSKTDQKQPFFLYLHFFDPHDPYTPPDEFKNKFSAPLTQSPFLYDAKMQEEINRYDGEINYLDSELGKFFEYLKSKKIYEDAFIVVVSDHGEQFMEHGSLRHGYNLFNEEIHVPLLMKTGRDIDKGRKIKETVSTLDLLPTILHRIGLTAAPHLPGISLMNEAGVKKRKGVMSEIRRVFDQKSVTDGAGARMILELPYSLSRYRVTDDLNSWNSSKLVGVFDSKNEYACKMPITDLALQARLKGTFDETLADAVKSVVLIESESAEIKDETLEQLKSLGYLQ